MNPSRWPESCVIGPWSSSLRRDRAAGRSELDSVLDYGVCNVSGKKVEAMRELRSGELAIRAGVNVETLRFYEREGLLHEPPRRPSGYRRYPADAIDVVRFIRRAQALGFSLKEIKELLTLRAVPRATCGDVVSLARKKVEEIDSKLRDLRSMKAALSRLLTDCTAAAPIARCPIIESLASGTEVPVSRSGSRATVDASRARPKRRS